MAKTIRIHGIVYPDLPYVQFQNENGETEKFWDPVEIIDDTAGAGDTDKVWSADKTTQELNGKIGTSEKGAANGVAELDDGGRIPAAQLPSYVDDVVEYADAEHFPVPGETGKIYVALDTNKTYRWSGSAYIEISESLALGETSSTAYRGDRGAEAYAHATKKGSAFVSGLYKIETNSEGHVIAVTLVEKEDITALGIPGSQPDITGKADKDTDAVEGNFAEFDSSGNPVDSGHKHSDYLTSHQDISGKADKVSDATSGNFAGLDGNGNLTDSGSKASDFLTEHQDISGKADKVSGATSGNFAGLDANGNLTDSGSKASDFLTEHQDISGKADKDTDAVEGNFASFDSNGNPVDSGKSANDFLETSAIDDTAGAGDTDKVWSANKLANENTLTATLDIPAAIQSFSDGAEWPVEMEIAVEPVQDLHGYANPWPGGGGKNLLPMTVSGIKAANTSGTWSGNAYTRRDVVYTLDTDDAGNIISINVNGTANNGNADLILYANEDGISGFVGMKLNGVSGGSTSTIGLAIEGVGILQYNDDYTIPSDYSTKKSFYVRVVSGVNVSNKKIYPMIRLASISDPTFEPYENKCPITGWDGANVSAASKNLIDAFMSTSRTTAPSIGLKPGQYTVSCESTIDNGTWYLGFFDKNGSNTFTDIECGLSGWSLSSSGYYYGGTNEQYISFTVPNECVLFKFYRTYSDTTKKAQIEIGSTKTAYEPYKGNIYSITFPTSAGTVYGGTLTVHADGTGTLVVDRAVKTLTGSDFIAESGTLAGRFWTDAGVIDQNKLERRDFLCNMASTYTGTSAQSTPNTTYISSNMQVVIVTTGFTLAQFQAYVNDHPYMLVYGVKPKTYTLSVPQVLSLLGQNNNVWADCGNINSLSYVRRQDLGFIREDTKGQIRAATDPIKDELGDAEAALAIVIDGDTAPKNIASGQYLFVKNHSTLATGAYHATAAISSGASVTGNNTEPDADGVVNSIVADLMTTKEVTNFYTSVASGTTVSSTICWKTGNIVYVTMTIVSTSNKSNLTACNFISGIRPKANVFSSAINDTDKSIITFSVYQNGDVHLYDVVANKTYFFTIMYPV